MLNESKIKRRTSYLCNQNLNVAKTHLKYILFLIKGISCLQKNFEPFQYGKRTFNFNRFKGNTPRGLLVVTIKERKFDRQVRRGRRYLERRPVDLQNKYAYFTPNC